MKQIYDEKIKSFKELEFAIFCIENIALKLGVKADKIYHALNSQSDLLYGYIIAEYEILHTQSRDYIVSDIIEVMEEAGIKI